MSIARQLDIPTLSDGLSIATFTQSLGSELIANNAFSTWAAGSPSSWTVQNNASSSVTEVAAGGGAGTGAARLALTSGGGVYPRVSQVIGSLTAGEWVEAQAVCSAFTSGQVDWYSTVSNWGWQISVTAATTYSTIGPVSQTPAYLYGISTALNMVFDSVSLRRFTLNPVSVTAANADNRFYFTLPGSPVRGEAVSLINRRVDASNYIELRLVRNAGNTDWDLRCHRVVAGVQTNNIITAVTSIGTVNGVRLECSGNTITAYTTTNSGGSWTSRGTNTNAANHATGTGVLPVYSSTITPVRLDSFPL